MSKLFLAFKGGKLLASPLQIPKPSYTSIHLGWDDLICQEGLIIPQNYASTLNARRFFDRKTTVIPGQSLLLQGLLIQLDGELLSFELTVKSEADTISQLKSPWTAAQEVVIDDSTSLYLPTSREALWARSSDSNQEEALYAALLLSTTHEEAQALIIRSAIDTAKFYQWYDYQELVSLMRTLHHKHYPSHPVYQASTVS